MLLTFCSVYSLDAQPVPAFPVTPVVFDGKGINFYSTDSVTKLNVRFRLQEHVLVSGRDDDDVSGPSQVHAMVRRARLRLESTVFDSRLKVNFQFSFARSDLDQEATGIANVLRDAYVTWQATPSFAVAIGQAKLPGNRQRLISSSELQLPDRSLLNSRFTVDRDVGVFLSWAENLGKSKFVLRGAVTGGEGRNPGPGDAGLAYTGRVEILPFGPFDNGGDYAEGSSGLRQSGYKLSVAAASSHNDDAVRTGGQLGNRLHESRSMTTHFADMMFKSGGFSLSAEYAHRISKDPVTRKDSDVRYVFAGQGVHLQTSWLIPGNKKIEPVLRSTWIQASIPVRAAGGEHVQESAIGIARYVNGHRIKYQLEFIRSKFEGLNDSRRELAARLGIEVGI